MRKEYDFSKSVRNPYLNRLAKQVSLNVDMETLSYFEKLEKDTGISYRNLMKLYLKDCAESERKPIVAWTPEA
jgi:hypothetical protein